MQSTEGQFDSSVTRP
nr:unnamed protein product [Callosobruchus chinensis]